MTCELWRDHLDAYVDGESPQPETAALEEHLRSCGDCAAEAFARLQIKRSTRAAALRFTPSPDFARRLAQSIAPPRRPLAFLLLPAFALAVALILLLALSATVMVRRSARGQALAQLVDLHVAALASPNPVDVVSSDRHTVKPWFQGKLPFTFNLPELAGSDYQLRGGKLVYFNHRPAAQLLFEQRKHELSLFIVQSAAPAQGSSTQAENGFTLESWSTAGLDYTIVSDTGPAGVHPLGELIRSAQR